VEPRALVDVVWLRRVGLRCKQLANH
jgi:hypothetical protein